MILPITTLHRIFEELCSYTSLKFLADTTILPTSTCLKRFLLFLLHFTDGVY